MGDTGIKVSRKGYDVTKCADRELEFSSAWNALKIDSTGTFTIADTGTQTIATHSLGYYPFYWVFIKDYSAYGWTNNDSILAYPGTSQYFQITTSKLEWTAGAGAAGDAFTGRYYIFKNKLTTDYSADSVETTDSSATSDSDIGIKVSKAGKSVYSDDYRDFVAISSSRTPSIHRIKTGSFGAADPGNNIEITHDLGYEPMFFMFALLDGETGYQMVSTADDSKVTATTTTVNCWIPYKCDYSCWVFKDKVLVD